MTPSNLKTLIAPCEPLQVLLPGLNPSVKITTPRMDQYESKGISPNDNTPDWGEQNIRNNLTNDTSSNGNTSYNDDCSGSPKSNLVSVIASIRSVTNGKVSDQTDGEEYKLSTKHLSDDCSADVEDNSIDDQGQAKDKKPYGGRPLKFKCHQCDRRFHAPSHLKRHILCHSSERPFVCSVCNKGFLQAWHLGRHMTTHTGNKPFQCSECPKSFGSRFEMNTHFNYIHKGIKEHQCQVCKKFFTLRSNLKVHMRKHTGEKPYGCHICYRRFGQRGHLQYHLQKHKRDEAGKAGKSEKKLPPPLIDCRDQPRIESCKETTPKSVVSAIVQSGHVDSQHAQPSLKLDPSLKTRESSPFGGSISPSGFQSCPSSPSIADDELSFIPYKRVQSADYSREALDYRQPIKRSYSEDIPCRSKIYLPVQPVVQKHTSLSKRIYDHVNPSEVKPFVCESCNCGFAEISSLRAHVRQAHERKGIFIGNFSCAFCKMEFSRVNDLELHIYSAHGSRDHLGEEFRHLEVPLTKMGHKRSWDEASISSEDSYRSSSSYTGSIPSPTLTIDDVNEKLHKDAGISPHKRMRTWLAAPSLSPPPPPPQQYKMSDAIQQAYLYHLKCYQQVLEAQVEYLQQRKYLVGEEIYRRCSPTSHR